jgi:uncharacterized protein with FMN-binding domain
MKTRYKVLIIITVIIVMLVVAGIIAFSNIQNSLETLSQTDIAEVDISAVPDGVYTGSYSQFPVSAEVRVTVSDHAITDIELVSHNHGPEHGADSITGEVINAQSLDVDAVSGATYSSKVILLAIEDALVNQLEG